MPPTERVRRAREPLTPIVLPTILPPETDEQKEDRVSYVLRLLAVAKPENLLLREVMVTFGVTREQAKLDLADTKAALRERLDDEGAIDGLVYGSLANLQLLRQEFTELALRPIPERMREVPAPMPEDPDEPYDPNGPGSTWRPLTPAEHAAAVGAKAQAAKVALTANETLVKIAGRRSTRWAEKPANVLLVAGDKGLSDEDKDLLKQLGMVK